ncbi:Basic-leucine zipper transcription factor [Parasponia andersonii]|uniref:Basic-leucine zipper transcription factor n=1 Tax=Parasponia andersonii TaxID=3476 RepID=A0A2P5BWB6_PARAD|nr:Basic-leucine zipper transcription factor [Parasponia andersonii]
MVSPNGVQSPGGGQVLPPGSKASLIPYHPLYNTPSNEIEIVRKLLSTGTGDDDDDHHQFAHQNPFSNPPFSSSLLPPSNSFLFGNMINSNAPLSSKTSNYHEIEEATDQDNWTEDAVDDNKLLVHQPPPPPPPPQLTNLSYPTSLDDYVVRSIGVRDIMETNQIPIVNNLPIMAAAIDPMVAFSQQQESDCLQSQLPFPLPEHAAIATPSYPDSEFDQKPVLGVDYSEEKPVRMPNSGTLAETRKTAKLEKTTSLDSQAAMSYASKRRRSDETMEKSIEKRRNRMMKNRESAARSRAKKQAYTNHLEQEVVRLRRENECLKKKKIG